MCGLVSILTTGRSLEDRENAIDAMLATILHRGPDANGKIHVKNQGIFAHCRLAIIDVEHGQQPMVSDDNRYTLVFNGEIYNYQELRHEMVQNGHHFESSSDTEVLFKLLIHEGVNAIEKLNGMFAFVFHDRKTNSWISARDPFGIKPLYYTELEDELLFASEIKALLQHPLVKVVRDDVALHQYLSLQFCLDERTLFSKILKIKPGFYFTGNGSTIESKVCFWDTDYNVDYHHTEDYFTDSIRSTVEDSVRLQMRSDVPLGAHLSGGIDSSLVSTLASSHLDHPIALFHGKFEEGEKYDESKYAKVVAENIQGEYFEVVPTAQGFVDTLPGLIYALDEPLAGPGVVPQYEVSRLARTSNQRSNL